MNTTTVPAITTSGDTARTRQSDPVTSHMAADESAKSLGYVKVGVLRIAAGYAYALTGIAFNTVYALRTDAQRGGFKRAGWDSPRKRAGELAKDGYLLAEIEPGARESVYSITPKGRAYLETVD